MAFPTSPVHLTSLHPQADIVIPEQTVRVACAAFPKRSRYMRMRDELGPVFAESDFADLFPRRGQPAVAPWRLALVTVMQFAENLTDRQAADAVRARLDWKYALSLELTDPGFDFSVLSEFRGRLLGGGAEDRLLDRMLELFGERGLVEGGGRQRTDVTHVVGAVRELNRLEIVGETLHAALNVLAQVAPAWLSAHLLTEYPARIADRAGLKAAVVGTFWLMTVTAAVAVPVGVGAAVYLEEYARPGPLLRIVTLNIANLAGVPSVIYGVLGLAVFVRVLGFGASFLSGGITLALLVLPVIVIATQEALRSIPRGVRESAYALGATRWQTVRAHLLPLAAPGALTGVILALSRAIGETAPILVVGAATFLAFLPATPLDAFSALPVQIYNWTSRPQDEFRGLAAAGILVLLALLLVMNGAAIWLRDRAERR